MTENQIFFRGLIGAPIMAVLAMVSAHASIISGPKTVLVSGSPEIYYIVAGKNGVTYDLLQKSNWTGDEAEAQALNTNLITIASAAQDLAVSNDIAEDFSASIAGLNLSAVPLWIGLNDKSHDPAFGGSDDYGSSHASDFVWADGAPVTYTDWHPGEPNDNPAVDGEYYTALNWYYSLSTSNPFGDWNDIPNASAGSYYGIALAVPEPSTGFVVGATCFGFLIRRRAAQRGRERV